MANHFEEIPSWQTHGISYDSVRKILIIWVMHEKPDVAIM